MPLSCSLMKRGSRQRSHRAKQMSWIWEPGLGHRWDRDHCHLGYVERGWRGKKTFGDGVTYEDDVEVVHFCGLLVNCERILWCCSPCLQAVFQRGLRRVPWAWESFALKAQAWISEHCLGFLGGRSFLHGDAEKPLSPLRMFTPCRQQWAHQRRVTQFHPYVDPVHFWPRYGRPLPDQS